jgi:NAD(P)-dependent dehydrogenase (short-subunit alcohol dehydrogenase family)
MSEQTIALVTGANKGIGYAIAAGLGALGWSVGVGARDERRREDAVAKLRAAGADAFGVPLDVTDDGSVTAAARLIEERTRRLDVLVNNAGVVGSWPDEPTTVTPESIRTVTEVNVIGVAHCARAEPVSASRAWKLTSSSRTSAKAQLNLAKASTPLTAPNTEAPAAHPW